MSNHKGLLIVLSGPSCVGKGTICKQIIPKSPNIKLSISETTRPPRGKDQDGVDYWFVTKEEFEAGIAADKYLEYEPVFDHYYGTPKAFVEKNLDAGFDVLLEIDVKGAMLLKERGLDATFIFVAPPSMAELERRFKQRNTETVAQALKRLATAREEMALMHKYDYVVVNDDLQQACKKVKKIISLEHKRRNRMAITRQQGLRYPAINDMIEKADNKYTLVMATAGRARRIVDGEPGLVEIGINNPVSIATAEINEDEVKVVSGEDYEALKQAEAVAAEAAMIEIQEETSAEEEAVEPVEAEPEVSETTDDVE